MPMHVDAANAGEAALCRGMGPAICSARTQGLACLERQAAVLASCSHVLPGTTCPPAGLVAPLCKPDVVFDFRLKHVQSINVSGHKYVATLGGGLCRGCGR